jgi:hypothetical protein
MPKFIDLNLLLLHLLLHWRLASFDTCELQFHRYMQHSINYPLELGQYYKSNSLYLIS